MRMRGEADDGSVAGVASPDSDHTPSSIGSAPPSPAFAQINNEGRTRFSIESCGCEFLFLFLFRLLSALLTSESVVQFRPAFGFGAWLGNH